jgi:hypothetical protein
MEFVASGMKLKPSGFNQNARGAGATPCGMNIKASGMKSIPHHLATK